MIHTYLSGHSGCHVVLCEDESHVYVRKMSSGKNYNDRLKKQAYKQEIFQSRFIKVPKVLRSGETEEGLYYFDMEYISGITLAEHMRTIETGKIRGLVDALMQYIMTNTDRKEAADERIFFDKIRSLKLNLARMENLTVDKALDVLETHSWKNFEKSACHGDLTLQNILVKDGQLFFIDFLDSFYDCWLLDIATLLQDVQVLWSYRKWKIIDMNTLIHLIIFRDILMDKIRTLNDGKWIQEVFYALLLKLLRIYPYTTDAKTLQFLNNKTTAVLSMIEKGDVTW